MYTLAPSRQIAPSCGSHTRKDKQIARSSAQWRTVSGWPRTAPKYSCYAQHTADLISYPASHWSGIPREREREQTEARERSSFFSQETLCGRGILVYCSSQPVDSLSRGRSFRVQGKVRGHVDSQDRLVSKENKLIPWERANIYSWHSPLSTSHCRKSFIRKAEVERLLKQAPVLSFLAWLWANSCRRRPCSNIPLLVLVLSFRCWTKADFRNQEAVKKKSWQKSSGCAVNLHWETSKMHDNHLKLTIQLIYFCLCNKKRRLGCGGN